MVKVILRGPDGEIETPWAETRNDGLLRLDNLPWFAYGISDDDLIEATATEDDGIFEFVRVVRPSGNRLIRIIFDDPHAHETPIERLQALGCHHEGANPEYIAVSIPASTDLQDVINVCDELGLQWEHANPTYKDLYGSE